MNGVKCIFIAMETVMLLGVILFTFLTDWVKETEAGAAWVFQLMIVNMAILAVIFQKEQQAIEWNEPDESGIELMSTEDVELQ
jgi:MFS-type transporter involved in bile tolerance (Atg22 family)